MCLLPPLLFVHISDIMSICASVYEPSCVFKSDSAACVCLDMYMFLCACQCVMCVIGYEASCVVV